jgi:hypothetical protein
MFLFDRTCVKKRDLYKADYLYKGVYVFFINYTLVPIPVRPGSFRPHLLIVL